MVVSTKLDITGSRASVSPCWSRDCKAGTVLLYLPTSQSCCDVNELARVKLGTQLSVVVPICHPSTWEAKPGEVCA